MLERCASVALRLDGFVAAGAGAIVAEARVVFQSTQILARGCQHRLRLDAEPCETVLGAHAVDGQGAIVVAGEWTSRHEIHGERLHARHRVGQSGYPAAPAGELGYKCDDFPQGVDLRAAQLVSLT